MRILFTISIFLFILTSCGKERSIKIKAINAATGQPYAGLEYRVASSRTAADGEKYRTEASGVLDSNGEALVNIKQKKGRTYSIRVVEPENTCYNKEITQYFDSPYDVNGTFTFEFAECAYLKLNINNTNCQDSNDLIKLFHTGSDVGFDNSISGNPIKTGSGCYNYLGTNFSDVPMGRRFYKWEVTKNSITNIYYDTIYLSPGEYKTYDINY